MTIYVVYRESESRNLRAFRTYEKALDYITMMVSEHDDREDDLYVDTIELTEE